MECDWPDPGRNSVLKCFKCHAKDFRICLVGSHWIISGRRMVQGMSFGKRMYSNRIRANVLGPGWNSQCGHQRRLLWVNPGEDSESESHSNSRDSQKCGFRWWERTMVSHQWEQHSEEGRGQLTMTPRWLSTTAHHNHVGWISMSSTSGKNEKQGQAVWREVRRILLFQQHEDEAEGKGQKSSHQRLTPSHPKKHLGIVEWERKWGGFKF